MNLAIKKRNAITLTTLASLFWGTSFVVNKIGLAYVDAYTFAFLRFFIASVTILLFVVPSRHLDLGLFRHREIWVVSAFNAGGFLFQYLGLTFTTASKAALLINASFVMVPLISRVLFQERFHTSKKIAVVLGLIGAVLLTTEGDLSIIFQGTLWGDLLIVVAGGIWAFFMIGNKRLLDLESNIFSLTAAIMTLTALFLFPFTMVLGSTDFLVMPWQAWAAILYTGIFCSLVAYFLWTTGLQELSVTASAIILLLEIVWALILAMFFLGEIFAPVAAVGASVLLISIFFVSRN